MSRYEATPEPSYARKAATKWGYGVAITAAATLLLLMITYVIPPSADWPPLIPPVIGVVTYYGVWALLSVTIETNE